LLGTNSGAMDDAINGGYKITTEATAFRRAQIDFNLKRHYSSTGAVCIGIISSVSSADQNTNVGFANNSPIQADFALYQNRSGFSFIRLLTDNNTTETAVDTSVSIDTNEHLAKIELRATSVTLTLENILESISTTNLPDTVQQPIFFEQTFTTTAKTANIKYCEAYNT